MTPEWNWQPEPVGWDRASEAVPALGSGLSAAVAPHCLHEFLLPALSFSSCFQKGIWVNLMSGDIPEREPSLFLVLVTQRVPCPILCWHRNQLALLADQFEFLGLFL